MIDGITILTGDCIASMRGLPDQSVHTCITSPPYFGLRSYLPDDHPDKALELGLEATPAEFVAAMVAVFREVRRVLRDDGTLWLNLGDSYASGGRKSRDPDAKLPQRGADFRAQDGLPEKNLIGIPWRATFALQDDGWYLRQDIIWHKPNPMPESVTDRCTKAHEYLFLLSKGPRYYFDQDAIKERMADSSVVRLAQPKLAEQAGSARVRGKTNGNMKAVGSLPSAKSRGVPPRHEKYASCDQSGLNDVGRGGMRNKRSVWSVATRPYSGAHFATFPAELIEPCVLAGSPIGGTVLDPFGGAGTTAGVALKHGRKAILCELNPESVDLMPERILSIAGHTADLFARAAE